MRKIIALSVATIALATVAHAGNKPKVSAYEACLTKLIKAEGEQYAIDHAGDTICDVTETARVERAYEKCLVQLIKAKGYKFAVDHAGDTVCDRKAKG